MNPAFIPHIDDGEDEEDKDEENQNTTYVSTDSNLKLSPVFCVKLPLQITSDTRTHILPL